MKVEIRPKDCTFAGSIFTTAITINDHLFFLEGYRIKRVDNDRRYEFDPDPDEDEQLAHDFEVLMSVNTVLGIPAPILIGASEYVIFGSPGSW